MTVRLAEPWANANGLVYGDARFTSVKAAYHQKAELDVDSLGDLKTGSALFPRKELSRLVAKEHGSIAVMTASMKLPSGATFPLYAIGQRRGPAVHTFLTTCGSFVSEIPVRFKNLKCMEDSPWTTPSVLNSVTKAQPMVDKFNRSVFDQLGMHDSFVTRCFETCASPPSPRSHTTIPQKQSSGS